MLLSLLACVLITDEFHDARVDADGDGAISETYGGDDCDDNDATAYPGADERWYDGTDEDCRGGSDYDQDGDGHDSDSFGGDDCDDTDGKAYPLADETCDATRDLNCDGQFGRDDNDGDGFPACEECDDGDSTVYPLAPETCDEVDNDCDREVDEDPVDAGTWYTDEDGDGHGLDDSAVAACKAPTGAAEVGGDCDDRNADVNPATTETCDGVDSDCDGPIDDGTTCYDDDGDGLTEEAGDCDDADAETFPEAEDRTTDGTDQDCDGVDGVDCSALRYHPAVDGLGQGDCYMGDGSNNTCAWSFCADGYNAVSGGLYVLNTGVGNLDDLWCLCEVGGQAGSTGILVGSNDSLTDVSGLNNVQRVGGDVNISCNQSLSTASAEALVNEIGLSNIGGSVYIKSNGSEYGSGC